MRSTMRDVRGGGRIIRGAVSSAGVVVDGIGFSVVRNGLGDYTVTFSQPFSAPPNVEATVSDSGNIGQIDAFTRTTSSFRVNTLSAAGAAADRGFTFIVIEQER